MSKPEFVTNLTRTFHRAGLQLKKHSPEILVVAGVVGVVTSAVMACKATTKIEPIKEEAHKKVEAIKQQAEDNNKETDDKEVSRALARVYLQTGFEFAKLYAPSVVLGGLSIGSILASNNIMRKRNVALAAAYTAVDSSYRGYRGRVIERFGEKLDRELKYGIKTEEVEEIEVDENGEQKVVKKHVETVGNEVDMYSPYARFFDDGCTGWEKDPEFNLMYLRTVQAHANDILYAEGHLFLNDVYEMLGIPKTAAGQVIGWVKDNPKGDGYVDFGIYDINKPKNRDFVNGYERTIILDFNVDGNILDLI